MDIIDIIPRILLVPISKRTRRHFSKYINDRINNGESPIWDSDGNNKIRIGDIVCFCEGHGRKTNSGPGTVVGYKVENILPPSHRPDEWNVANPTHIDRNVLLLSRPMYEDTYENFCRKIGRRNDKEGCHPSIAFNNVHKFI